VSGRRRRLSAGADGGGERRPPASALVNGVRIDAVSDAELLHKVDAFVASGESHVVHFCAAHTTVLARTDAEYRSTLNRGSLNVADGVPVAVAARIFGADAVRISGSDALPALCEHGVDAGLRHFLWGGSEDVVADLRRALEAMYPGIVIVGAEAPPFRPLIDDDYATAAAQMREVRADLVWVGLGTPKQDIASEALRRAKAAPVILSVGAAFDFVSGHKPRASKWMQRAGLEWAHRLADEPRRLWRRYLFGNPQFIAGVAYDYVRRQANLGHPDRRPLV
jgi:N-acetylglucosaminyldiphosphoundecaprenol N-acetyl-beta-D-mannosaminyltransferase